MSAPIEQLRQAAKLSVKEHLGIFDHYIALGRDIEYIAIKFGYDLPMIVTILEGYGERVCDESCGRLRTLPQTLVKEYINHFYPGIASENPENDWIHIEAYLDIKHPGWRKAIERGEVAEKEKFWKGGLY